MKNKWWNKEKQSFLCIAGLLLSITTLLRIHFSFCVCTTANSQIQSVPEKFAASRKPKWTGKMFFFRLFVLKEAELPRCFGCSRLSLRGPRERIEQQILSISFFLAGQFYRHLATLLQLFKQLSGNLHISHTKRFFFLQSSSRAKIKSNKINCFSTAWKPLHRNRSLRKKTFNWFSVLVDDCSAEGTFI